MPKGARTRKLKTPVRGSGFAPFTAQWYANKASAPTTRGLGKKTIAAGLGSNSKESVDEMISWLIAESSKCLELCTPIDKRDRMAYRLARDKLLDEMEVALLGLWVAVTLEIRDGPKDDGTHVQQQTPRRREQSNTRSIERMDSTEDAENAPIDSIEDLDNTQFNGLSDAMFQHHNPPQAFPRTSRTHILPLRPFSEIQINCFPCRGPEKISIRMMSILTPEAKDILSNVRLGTIGPWSLSFYKFVKEVVANTTNYTKDPSAIRIWHVGEIPYLIAYQAILTTYASIVEQSGTGEWNLVVTGEGVCQNDRRLVQQCEFINNPSRGRIIEDDDDIDLDVSSTYSPHYPREYETTESDGESTRMRPFPEFNYDTVMINIYDGTEVVDFSDGKPMFQVTIGSLLSKKIIEHKSLANSTRQTTPLNVSFEKLVDVINQMALLYDSKFDKGNMTSGIGLYCAFEVENIVCLDRESTFVSQLVRVKECESTIWPVLIVNSD
ncbi:hypothetical protein IQ07DRAFT_595031 [Pyrenochaeta sp. DS3sAY3a]|nr:hypothetical protein IQ07DRAFT_595031 [Pyrenochaeta sp. DS3sAY3a]